MVEAIGRDREADLRLRALYRDHKPGVRWNGNKMIVDQAQQTDQWRIVRAEFERLYGRPSLGGELEHILKSAWIEERELRGERYDRVLQAWIGPDGEPIRD